VTRIAGLRAVTAVALTVGVALLLACSTPTADMKREASARMQMGVTYLEQRNLPSAMRELTRAAELDPDNSEIAMTLGLAYQPGEISKSRRSTSGGRSAWIRTTPPPTTTWGIS